MKVKKLEYKAAEHKSVLECKGYGCIYFEGCNPIGNRQFCSAYREWVDEITKCSRYMDKKHPYPNPFYKIVGER